MVTTASEFHDVVEGLHRGSGLTWTTAVLHEKSDLIVETLSALANMPEGGSIIFGLDPSNGFVPIGLSDAETLEQTIEALAQQQIEPAPRVQFYRATVENQPVVVVTVHGLPAEQRPCRVVATDKAYVRGPEGNYPMSARDMYRLQSSPERRRDDQTPVDGTTQEHLHIQRTEAFLHSARAEPSVLHEATDEQILRMKGILEPQGERLTIAGLYVLGRYPQQFFPNLSLNAVVRSSQEHDEILEFQRFDGPLPELVENAVRWVLRNTRGAAEHHLSQRGERNTEIPILAIREVITNALTHRELSPHALSQPVEVTLENGLLTVSNPDGLRSISSDQLGKRPGQVAVNETLYEICRLTPVAGGHRITGSTANTLQRVHQVMRRAAMHAPQYIDSGLDFTVILGRRIELTVPDQQWLDTLPHKESLTTTQRYMLVFMGQGYHWDPIRLTQELGRVEAGAVEEQLKNLVERELVIAPDKHAPGYRLRNEWQHEGFEPPSKRYKFKPSHIVTTPDVTFHTPEEVIAEPEPTAEDSAHRAAASSKHGATLWNVLQDGPKDIHDLAQGANLSLSQVRYAMQRLVADGLVLRHGGQGHRQTVYTVA